MATKVARPRDILLNATESAALEDFSLPPDSEFSFRDSEGREIDVPKVVQETILKALKALSEHGEVSIARMPEELSSNTAADILGVSRPTLMKWAKEGKIRSFKVNSHNRFKRDDVLEFKRARTKQRAAAFNNLREFDLEHFGPISN